MPTFGRVKVFHYPTKKMHVLLYRSGPNKATAVDSLADVLDSKSLLRKRIVRSGKVLRLSRVTVCTQDLAFASTLTPSGTLRSKYDLVAIQPLSSSVLEEVGPHSRQQRGKTDVKRSSFYAEVVQACSQPFSSDCYELALDAASMLL